ncbi:hypothetical protein EMO89_01600 [Bifidobacterium tissieri]|uniref:Uncharacterized protein n=1 Tax=Bifidobacterium tissieri TaxID=1630162 RepID=A0A5M9ZUZ7_9BIFI|nr:hypothetical protein [Bifidobacterium tissieri]KAA8831456.1 hypothetical protein EMO89_01600 [Bifidobacterium tissieri]
MPSRCCKYCGKPLPPNVTARCEYCPGGTCRKMAYKKRKAKGEPAPPKPKPKPPTLNSREFDRMMDGSVEDSLRYVRDRLKTYLDDPGTPANAVANISRQYITVCERLDQLSGNGTGLFDDETETVSEVSEDVGASIV